MPCRIIIADDHRVLREGLRSLIDSHQDLKVIGECGDGQAALEQIQKLRPDVLILDISMPKLNGLQLINLLAADESAPRVLVLTAYVETTYVRQMLAAGARGFIAKRSAAADLITAIRTVAAGGTYLDPEIAGKVATGFVQQKRVRAEREGEELSPREEEVLKEVARGYSNKEIAARLSISVKTVETHKSNVMEKLGLSSRAEMVRYALLQGWLEDE
jgi:DNA-binding NarL/FixJ family response regulator